MSQKTLNSYFAVRKRPANQHPAKTRKLDNAKVIEQLKEKVKTKSVENEDAPSELSNDIKSESKEDKAHDVEENTRELPISKEQIESAKKAKEFLAAKERNSADSLPTNSRDVKTAPDEEASENGKKRKRTKSEETHDTEPEKINTKKVVSTGEKSSAQKETEATFDRLEKCTPAEVKAKIGQVKKLSDLKARLQALNTDKNFATTGENKHRRQLFSPPQLSKEDVTLEIETLKPKPIVSPITSPVKSDIKASPRKIPQYIKHADLLIPDGYMPLPRKYKFLAEIFRSVDDVVGMKFNRHEIVRVSALKSAVQNIIRKTFHNDYLRQIRCVFPKAYIYTWEKILDRLGRHSSGDYELQMLPDMTYNESSTSASENTGNKGCRKLGPKEKVERVRLFNHSLLQIAKDYHQDFLISLGWTKKELDKEITKWHSKFDVEEHCPDIDIVEFPSKPSVERMSNAKDMIEKFASVNPRLENVLKEKETSSLKKKELEEEKSGEMTKLKNPEVASDVEEPKVLKGLRGLPPALLQKILAKQKEKNVQDVTQNSEKRKRIEQMEELISVAPYIVNCHRSIKNGAAVAVDILTKITADSYGHGKTKDEMLKLVKLFLNLVPECMELRTYDRITYIKKKKDSPDINVIKAKLQKLVDQEKQS